MKKSDWVYLANAMWTYAEKHDGEISSLLKELVIIVNNNKEMIINDMGEYEQDARSDRPIDYDSTSSEYIKKFG